MKDFLKKLFFVDAPAQGVFAALTLLLVMLRICPAVYLLAGGPLRMKLTSFLRILIPLLLISVCIWLTAFIRFHRERIMRLKPDWNSPRMLVCCGFLLAALGTAPWLAQISWAYGICGLLVIAVWAVPAASLWENWQLWLARGLCWTGAFCCLDHSLKCIRLSCRSICSAFWAEITGAAQSSTTWLDAGYSPYADLTIVFLGAILLPAGWLLSAKLYAAAAAVRFRDMFGRTVKILLGVWVAVYLISYGMALAQSRAAERTTAELGKFFGYELNARGMTKLLTEKKWFDGPSRQTIPGEYVELIPIHRRHLFDRNVVLPEKERKNWQSELERSEALRKLEAYFDQPIRPGFRTIRDGDILRIYARPHLNFYQFGVCERWKIVFLAEQGRTAEALAVLQRLENALEFYRRNPAFLFGRTFYELNLRIPALEMLLDNEQVPVSELERWEKNLKLEEKSLEKEQIQNIYADLLHWIDRYHQLAHGYCSMPMYPLRHLNPAWWYFSALDREMTLKQYRHRRWRDIPDPPDRPGRAGFLYGRVHGPVSLYARQIDSLTAKYRAMRALIGIELEKRRTGKYPDTLANPPVDPFTGKPMLYKKGKMPLIVKVWDPALGRLIPERREADGIAVWSLGWNRKNEQGQDQATVRKYADDIRAKMIFKKASSD